MFCPKCGQMLSKRARFCTACGAAVKDDSRPGESSGQRGGYTSYQQYHSQPGPVAQVDFGEAISRFWRGYAQFQGRSRRSEYWWVVLVHLLVSYGLAYLGFGWLDYLWSLVIFVPTLALMVRRLHDAGKSGLWLLFNFLPLVGQIILLIQFCKDSAPANQWGPNPKA